MTKHSGLGIALLLAAGAVGCGGGDESSPALATGGAAVSAGGASGIGGSLPGGGAGTTGGASGGASGGGSGGTATGGTPTGGGAPAGGTATAGGGTAPATGGSTATGDCAITAQSELSSAIATVGIVTFTTDLGAIEEAHIDFGLDTTYGMTAPVDLGEPSYRTLLLGMKQSREYHYRIVTQSGGSECASQDYTITTGRLPNILPQIDTNTLYPDRLAGGFILTGQYEAMGGANSPAYIIDADGDFVWALAVGNYVTGVRMSYDAKYMWINGTDNTTSGQANIHRVTLDGLSNEDLSDAFGFQDHTLTILPDDTVIFWGHQNMPCPDIRHWYPDGHTETIINARDAHGASGDCHVNAMEYSPWDQSLVFSDDFHNNYTKITMDGQVIWVLGGDTNQFTGDGSSWSRQHGINLLGLDRFVYFNNGAMGQVGTGSLAIELQLDLNAMTATRVWTYASTPPIQNQQLGDVQRLANGNTVVAYSTQGVLQEVDAGGNLLQEITWPIGGAFGYIVKRSSLYGPPPR